jgi:ribosomal protein L13E
VQDTVRETKVEVDQGKRRKEGATSAELAAAGNKPASARKPNSTP